MLALYFSVIESEQQTSGFYQQVLKLFEITSNIANFLCIILHTFPQITATKYSLIGKPLDLEYLKFELEVWMKLSSITCGYDDGLTCYKRFSLDWFHMVNTFLQPFVSKLFTRFFFCAYSPIHTPMAASYHSGYTAPEPHPHRPGGSGLISLS